MEQRQAKLEALRIRMGVLYELKIYRIIIINWFNTVAIGRQTKIETGVVDEHQRRMTTARDLVRLEKQRKLAAILREKTDAEEKE